MILTSLAQVAGIWERFVKQKCNKKVGRRFFQNLEWGWAPMNQSDKCQETRHEKAFKPSCRKAQCKDHFCHFPKDEI